MSRPDYEIYVTQRTIGGMLITWMIAVIVWACMGRPIQPTWMSKILVACSLCPAIRLARKLGLSKQELGLALDGIGPALVTDTLLTLVLVVAAVVTKILFMNFMPGSFDPDLPFVRWDKYPAWEWGAYAVSVVAQEFLIRGVTQGAISRVVKDKWTPVWLAALVAALFHVQCGMAYMVGSAILVGAAGCLYSRQRSIWGLCIPHYVLGWVFGLLDFVVY